MPERNDTSWSSSGWCNALGGRTARIDPMAPLRGIEVQGRSHHDRLLGIDLAVPGPSIADWWVRGRDMTVVCEPRDGRLLKATTTWRHWPGLPGIDAWEAIVSAQTSRLDSDATISVVSHVAVEHLLTSVGTAEWVRSAGGTLHPEVVATLARRPETSVLITVHPIDLRRIDLEVRDSVARIDCRLFASTVEKGVLLRSRVLGAIGPRTGDEGWAAELLATFAASAPPLTT